MNLKFIWMLFLFLAGFMALNNYFSFFKNLILVDDKSLLLILGVFGITAGFVIILQSILLAFHNKF